MTRAAPLHATTSVVGLSVALAAERRIVLNGRFVGQRVTGVQRYAGEIVRALDALVAERHSAAAGMQFVLATPAQASCDLPLTSIPVVRVGRLSGYAWEQIDLPLFAGRDLTLNLCNFAPVVLGRNITCVHDAHVWLAPQNFSVWFRLAYRLLQPLLLRRSVGWVTVSRHSGEQLLSLGVAKRRPDAVTPNGADHAIRWSPARATVDAERLPERFVLALGSRSPNKNFALVRRLAELLAPRGIGAVIAGGDDSRVFNTRASADSSPAIELGRVSDDDLAFLFSRARAFLFPSLHEGFGLPPVEAMLLGCPVIASNTSAIPEVLGDAAQLPALRVGFHGRWPLEPTAGPAHSCPRRSGDGRTDATAALQAALDSRRTGGTLGIEAGVYLQTDCPRHQALARASRRPRRAASCRQSRSYVRFVEGTGVEVRDLELTATTSQRGPEA